MTFPFVLVGFTLTVASQPEMWLQMIPGASVAAIVNPVAILQASILSYHTHGIEKLPRKSFSLLTKPSSQDLLHILVIEKINEH